MDNTSRRWGTALVAAQFGLIGVLATVGALGWVSSDAGAGTGHTAWRVAAMSVLLAAAAVGAAALTANRPGNFNIHPTPRAGGHLITTGLYGRIRHPMYTAVLLGGLAGALLAPRAGWVAAVAALAAWAALAAVLWAKSSVEERWMTEAHPGYADYRRRTRRFVPALF